MRPQIKMGRQKRRRKKRSIPSFKTALWWLLGVRRGKEEMEFGERWGASRHKSRRINQGGEGNLTVCMGLAKAFAGISLLLLGERC